jgi:hypothetical protein
MSTYLRAPRKVTVHCAVPDCGWLRTYFAKRSRFTLEMRAMLGLGSHVRTHRRRVTLINGR